MVILSDGSVSSSSSSNTDNNNTSRSINSSYPLDRIQVTINLRYQHPPHQQNYDDGVFEGIIAVVEPTTNSELNQPSTEVVEPTTNSELNQPSTEVDESTTNIELNQPSTDTNFNVELKIDNNELTLITQAPLNSSQSIPAEFEQQLASNTPREMPPPPS